MWRHWPSPLKSDVLSRGNLNRSVMLPSLSSRRSSGQRQALARPVVQLTEVLDVVRDLITSRLFYGALGVLTSVAMYHLDLDFATICNRYADG